MLAFIIEHSLILPGDRVLAAVSGGPDSVCLARILADLCRRPELPFTWTMLHVQHGLRGAESERDEQFCRALADTLQVPCIVKEADIPAARSRGQGSVEMAARRERYRLFLEAALAFPARRICLGHHADDNAETVLFRILRGTGLRGLAGIPVRRTLSQQPEVEIVRPLLEETRAELQACLDGVGQAYCTDSSNLSLRPVRNRIRLHLLPELEKVGGPGVRGNLLCLAAHARSATDWLDHEAREALGGMTKFIGDRTVRLDALALAQLPRAIRIAAFSGLVERLMGGGPSLLAAHYEALEGLLKSGHGELHLPRGLRASIESGSLFLEKRGSAQPPSPFALVELAVPGRVDLPGGGSIHARLLGPPFPPLEEIRKQAPTLAYLDWNAVRPPLRVRGPQPGDSFQPLGMTGPQKLQDLFVNLKVPRRERPRIPVVLDQQGIVWVAGYRLSHAVSIAFKTSCILELRLDLTI